MFQVEHFHTITRSKFKLCAAGHWSSNVKCRVTQMLWQSEVGNLVSSRYLTFLAATLLRPSAATRAHNYVTCLWAEERAQAAFRKDSDSKFRSSRCASHGARKLRSDLCARECWSCTRARPHNRFTTARFLWPLTFWVLCAKVCEPQRNAGSKNPGESHTMKTRRLKRDVSLHCAGMLDAASRLVPKSLGLEVIRGVRCTCTRGRCGVINACSKPYPSTCCSKCDAVCHSRSRAGASVRCLWRVRSRADMCVHVCLTLSSDRSEPQLGQFFQSSCVFEVMCQWIVFICAGEWFRVKCHFPEVLSEKPTAGGCFFCEVSHLRIHSSTSTHSMG